MLLNAAKFQGYSCYRFWVIKGKPTGGGGKLPHPTQIRVNGTILSTSFVLLFLARPVFCYLKLTEILLLPLVRKSIILLLLSSAG